MGRLRKYRVRTGATEIVELPSETLDALEDAIDIMDDGMVDESVVLRELHITKKTLLNLIYCGKISRDMYSTAVNGVRKFNIKKILGERIA